MLAILQNLRYHIPGVDCIDVPYLDEPDSSHAIGNKSNILQNEE